MWIVIIKLSFPFLPLCVALSGSNRGLHGAWLKSVRAERVASVAYMQSLGKVFVQAPTEVALIP